MVGRGRGRGWRGGREEKGSVEEELVEVKVGE